MTTPNLQLPELTASQSQPHVTVNSTFRRLDGLVQLAVVSRVSELPADSPEPAEGTRYMIVDGSPAPDTGDVDTIAQWVAGAWQHYTPESGWLCWVIDERALYVYEGPDGSPVGWSLLIEL